MLCLYYTESESMKDENRLIQKLTSKKANKKIYVYILFNQYILIHIFIIKQISVGLLKSFAPQIWHIDNPEFYKKFKQQQYLIV